MLMTLITPIPRIINSSRLHKRTLQTSSTTFLDYLTVWRWMTSRSDQGQSIFNIIRISHKCWNHHPYHTHLNHHTKIFRRARTTISSTAYIFRHRFLIASGTCNEWLFLPLLLADVCRTNYPSSTVPEQRYGAGVTVDTRLAWHSLWTWTVSSSAACPSRLLRIGLFTVRACNVNLLKEIKRLRNYWRDATII